MKNTGSSGKTLVVAPLTRTTVTWSGSSKFYCRVIVTQQRSIVQQFAREFRNLPLQAKKRIELHPHNCMLLKQWTWLWCSVSYRQINCHCKI